LRQSIGTRADRSVTCRNDQVGSVRGDNNVTAKPLRRAEEEVVPGTTTRLRASSPMRWDALTLDRGYRVTGVDAPVGTVLSGRPPDRARRADFPHRAPTFGLRASEARARPGVHDTRGRKRIAGSEALGLRY
jgi:hypothetical protein